MIASARIVRDKARDNWSGLLLGHVRMAFSVDLHRRAPFRVIERALTVDEVVGERDGASIIHGVASRSDESPAEFEMQEALAATLLAAYAVAFIPSGSASENNTATTASPAVRPRRRPFRVAAMAFSAPRSNVRTSLRWT